MSIEEKLDKILAIVEKTADQVIKLDQNVIVLAGRADAVEHEVIAAKPAFDQLQRAVVLVAGDVQDIRQRLFDEAERADRRLKVLEAPNGSNGRHD